YYYRLKEEERQQLCKHTYDPTERFYLIQRIVHNILAAIPKGQMAVHRVYVAGRGAEIEEKFKNPTERLQDFINAYGINDAFSIGAGHFMLSFQVQFQDFSLPTFFEALELYQP